VGPRFTAADEVPLFIELDDLVGELKFGVSYLLLRSEARAFGRVSDARSGESTAWRKAYECAAERCSGRGTNRVDNPATDDCWGRFILCCNWPINRGEHGTRGDGRLAGST
jgi:hypothetical protein